MGWLKEFARVREGSLGERGMEDFKEPCNLVNEDDSTRWQQFLKNLTSFKCVFGKRETEKKRRKKERRGEKNVRIFEEALFQRN